VPVPPAVAEAWAKPSAGDLAAQFGLEAAASVAGAGHHRALEVAQLRLHIRLERAGDVGEEFHTGIRKN
jgi:hypothetical protein